MSDTRTLRVPASGFAPGLLLVVFALIFVLATVAQAQAPEKAQIDAWRLELSNIEAALQRNQLDDAALAGLRDRVEPVRIGTRTMSGELGPRIQALRLRLGIPSDGEKTDEPKYDASPETARDRKLLADLESARRSVGVLQERADDILARITERRRDLLVSTVTARSPSLIDPSLWVETIGAMPRLGLNISRLLSDWWTLLKERGPGPAAAALLIALAFAAGFLGPGRRLLLRFSRSDDPSPDLLEKAFAALWVTLVNAMAPTVALGMVLFVIQTFRLIPGRLEAALPGIVLAVGFSSLLVGLARGVFAPGRPNWRIASMPDEVANRLTLLVSSVAATAAVALIGGVLLDSLFATKETLAAWRGLATVGIAILVMVALRTVATRLAAEDGGLPFPWSLVVPASWLASITAVAAGTFGFVMLGAFIVTQLLWTSTVLALLFLMLIVVEGLFSAAFQAKTPIGMTLARSLGISGAKIEQLGVVVSGVARLLLIIVAGMLALAPYGIESGDVFGWLDTVFSGITIGGITLSLTALLAAFGLFLIGVIATRGVQRWLDTQFLPRTRMDAGLRTSVRTGIGYAGIVAAAMIAFGSLGLNLSNIAIVAGALSVGIGFGLQSVVNNFVSGLILLAERPIRTGDWIVVGGEQGIVKRINIRATEIETFDRATVIIPNSDLISGAVKNWVHADRTARVTIPIGVSHDCDAGQVRALLLECVRSHPNVLIYPEPRVFFMRFGESTLDFEVFCYVDDVNNLLSTKSDLLFAILARLKEANIDIPFRQNDVTIRNLDDVIVALKAFTDAASAASAPKLRGRRTSPAAQDAQLENAD